ncbi:MAG: Gldg family protein [Clostridia bacterium]|nr:Gldg family protein [Clostridia bacterium]
MKKKNTNLSTKYLKTGGYSIILSLVAIAIVIFVNLFVNRLPTNLTRFDMSSNDVLSLGEKTTEIAKGIEQEVTVYYVQQHGAEDERIISLLDKYKALNKKLTIKQIDPAINPGFFTGEKEDVQSGSIIVESEKRMKIISVFELYYPGVSETEIAYYYQQYGSMPAYTGFALESCVTAALNYVTTDNLPVMYVLKGHNEYVLSDTYASYLDAESIQMKELNLATSEKVPEDCDCLLINLPEKDISEDEAEKILAYLKKGGKLMYNSWYKNSLEEPHKNLASVMEYYGVKGVEGLVIEGDANMYIPNQPTTMIPNFGSHSIVDVLKGYYLFTADNCGIEISKELRESLTVTPLLTTSSKAYARPGYNKETIEKVEGDIDGPFNLAVAITEDNEDGSQTQIVWVNSPSLVNESLNVYGTNAAMFIYSIGWMCDKEEADLSIEVKKFEENSMVLTEAQSMLLTVVFMIVLPLAVVVTGVVVWLRRRAR